jgi:hypothetical protein
MECGQPKRNGFASEAIIVIAGQSTRPAVEIFQFIAEAMTATLMMSSTLQPRDKSIKGRRKP